MRRRRFLRLAALSGAGFLGACRRGTEIRDLSDLERLDDPELAAEIARQATAIVTPPPPTPDVPLPSPRDFGIDSDIRLTHAERFYVMKFGALPDAADLDEAGWALEVVGLDDGLYRFDMGVVRALPSETFMRTLCCISNPAGGDLIGNAVWRGCRFRELLALAGIDSDSSEGLHLRLESLDGYHTGVPLSLALDERSFLVYELNGEPLRPEHGRPIRCLFPGRFGQKQPKWLTRISVVETPHAGHWEAQGWSQEAPIQVMSRIDRPANRGSLQVPAELGGIAFAGLSGLKSVSLIFDDRETVEAEIQHAPEPYRDLVWAEWRLVWPDGTPGRHKVLARARDGAGQGQRRPKPQLLSGTFPDGTLEMHGISIDLLARTEGSRHRQDRLT